MILATKAAIAHSGAGLPYQWVAVGENGFLSTSNSTTVSSWTTRTSSFGSTIIRGVASNGMDLYVAVGDSGKLATSPDGITWTQRTSSFSTTNINYVAYADNLWIAVGDSGKLATSPDGITWTQRTSGTAVAIYKIAYGNNLWFYNALNTGASSTNGTTWTLRTTTLSFVNPGALSYSSVSGTWIVGQDAGTSGSLASSTNGTTWTARNTPLSLSNTANAGAEANGSVLVYTSDARIFTSTNGTSFTSRTSALGYYKTDVAVDDTGTFVIVSEYIATAQAWSEYSTDGTTWTAGGMIWSDPSTSYPPWCICHSSNKFAAR